MPIRQFYFTTNSGKLIEGIFKHPAYFCRRSFNSAKYEKRLKNSRRRGILYLTKSDFIYSLRGRMNMKIVTFNIRCDIQQMDDETFRELIAKLLTGRWKKPGPRQNSASPKGMASTAGNSAGIWYWKKSSSSALKLSVFRTSAPSGVLAAGATAGIHLCGAWTGRRLWRRTSDDRGTK